MKKFFYILVLLLCCSCSNSRNEKQEEGQQKQEDLTAQTDKDQEPNSSEEDVVDPFARLVCSLSANELEQRIGTKRPQKISDFFLLLPDTTVINNLKTEARVALLSANKFKNLTAKQDQEHQFLSIIDDRSTRWEMFAQRINDDIWTSIINDSTKDKTWEILVYQANCDDICLTQKAIRYYYNNGRLVKYNAAMLNGYQDYSLELFLNRDAFSDDLWSKLENRFYELGSKCILFDLPRDGKTIKMFTDPRLFEDFGVKKEDYKCVETDLSEGL